MLNATLIVPYTTFVADDLDNTGNEQVGFSIEVTDNVAVGNVTCMSGAAPVSLIGGSGNVYAFSGVFPIGTAGVTRSAADVRSNPAPNVAEASFLVVVRDVTPPAFDLSGGTPGAPFSPSIPAEATSPEGAVVFYTTPAASDSSGAVDVVCESANGLRSGDQFPVGKTKVNCVATDTSGNSTPPTNLFDLDVRDTTAPVITLAGAAVMNVELKSAFTDPGATAVDVVSAVVTVTRTGTVNTNVAGSYTLSYVATDAAGNTTTATRTVIVADTQPPVIDTSATPNVLLWSPNKTMTPVTVSGTAIDANLVSVTFAVVDEYKKVQPSGTVSVNANGTYAFVIKLEAYRNGNDSNGRVYTITVTARDASGRTAATSTVVLVPHNQ